MLVLLQLEFLRLIHRHSMPHTVHTTISLSLRGVPNVIGTFMWRSTLLVPRRPRDRVLEQISQTGKCCSFLGTHWYRCMDANMLTEARSRVDAAQTSFGRIKVTHSRKKLHYAAAARHWAGSLSLEARSGCCCTNILDLVERPEVRANDVQGLLAERLHDLVESVVFCAGGTRAS